MTTTKTKTGTFEWAKHRLNIVKGCENDCLYCYAKAASSQRKQTKPEEWQYPVPNKSKNNRIIKKDGLIMYPTTHDITPSNLEDSIDIIHKHVEIGNEILIVSKPRLDCIMRIADTFLDYQNQILFRFSIGSADNTVLKFWEPNASCYEERVQCLKYVFQLGYNTSISCEPMLDDDIDFVINDIRGYVSDSIWIGKMKMLKTRLKLNRVVNAEVEKRATELLELQNDVAITRLYERYRDDNLIKWKDSIKEVVGLSLVE